MELAVTDAALDAACATLNQERNFVREDTASAFVAPEIPQKDQEDAHGHNTQSRSQQAASHFPHMYELETAHMAASFDPRQVSQIWRQRQQGTSHTDDYQPVHAEVSYRQGFLPRAFPPDQTVEQIQPDDSP